MGLVLMRQTKADIEKNSNEFGRYLRKYRKTNNMTQQKLADMLNISMSYLGCIERGVRNPSISLLLHISNILNVSIDKLLGSESEYTSRQVVSEYLERINALPRKERDLLCEVIKIFLSIMEKK